MFIKVIKYLVNSNLPGRGWGETPVLPWYILYLDKKGVTI